MDVSGGQLGVVVLNDLIEGEFLIDELQDILYRDSRTGDARFAEGGSRRQPRFCPCRLSPDRCRMFRSNVGIRSDIAPVSAACG